VLVGYRVAVGQCLCCEVCGVQSDSASIFPSQYKPTNTPYSSSSTCCCYQKDKRAKPGNFTKSSTLSGIGHIGWRSTCTYKSLVFGRLIDTKTAVRTYAVLAVCELQQLRAGGTQSDGDATCLFIWTTSSQTVGWNKECEI
jgi:hypothetical protein